MRHLTNNQETTPPQQQNHMLAQADSAATVPVHAGCRATTDIPWLEGEISIGDECWRACSMDRWIATLSVVQWCCTIPSNSASEVEVSEDSQGTQSERCMGGSWDLLGDPEIPHLLL
ncbi:hypothetical protein B0H13DRAFT_1856485 [Mycena leptocephala]|nr:hypothetical protein B0H13DRAFT_1856485 [Mycena leptocephala]